MKIVVFGPERRVGALHGDAVVDLAAASAGQLPAELGAFIETGDRGLEAAQRALEAASQSNRGTVALASTRLHAPHVRGARVACAGGNFADHSAAMERNRRGGGAVEAIDIAKATQEMRERGMWGFWKVVRDATPTGGEVIYPSKTQRFDYEAELAIVLGKAGKDVPRDRWREYVWGVTLFGDWSLRDSTEPNTSYKFCLAKNFDTSFSMGPCIVAGEGIDPLNVEVTLKLNGEVRQHFNSGSMVFDYGEYLAYLSADLTFYPGDVISGGTAAGTAADSSVKKDGAFPPDRFLKVGDAVEISSPAIGALTATIVAKAPAALPVGAR